MTISLWDDMESPEQHEAKRAKAYAIAATASLDPYFMESKSPQDFENRLGLADGQIQAVASQYGVPAEEIADHYRRRASLVVEANESSYDGGGSHGWGVWDHDNADWNSAPTHGGDRDARWERSTAEQARDMEIEDRRFEYGDDDDSHKILSVQPYYDDEDIRDARKRIPRHASRRTAAQDHEIEAWVNPNAWDDQHAAQSAIEDIKDRYRNGTEEQWLDVVRRWDKSGKHAAKKMAISEEELDKIYPPCPECGERRMDHEETHESHSPCEHPWCVENEPFHTNAEHIDPPHLDPGHADYQSAQRNIEDAFRGNEEAWLIHHQNQGPSKYSSRKQAVFFDEHPETGLRAEYHGGPRLHVYDGEHPVDSPYIDGYSNAMRSSEAEDHFRNYSEEQFKKDFRNWHNENYGDYGHYEQPYRHGSRRQANLNNPHDRVALVKRALDEGVDPLQWLIELAEAAANNVGAEKPDRRAHV